MDFISNQEPQIQEMLAALGMQSIEELYSAIPQKLKASRPDKDDGLSEYEGIRLMESIASKNSFPSYENYLGAGAYEHYVPALVGAICGKSEFLTSYTPYQAEASQGMLQAIFEFQTAICALTGMDASNASLYDGSTACAEAILMALRFKPECNKVVVARSLHPHYKDVIKQYLKSHQIEIAEVPFRADGGLELASAADLIDEKTAALLIQSPNFFGVIEQAKESSVLAKEKGALTILAANPLMYGLFASAGELGVDIAVGDCQPFGLPLQFGGPYAGS